MHRHATLNRVYRLIWDRARECWVVVSELCKGRGKAGRVRRLAAVAGVLGTLAGPAVALPTDGQVTSGNG